LINMGEPTFSPDGKWMWNGDEWIPAPPNQEPSVVVRETSTKRKDEYEKEILRLQYERHIETLTKRSNDGLNAMLFFGICLIVAIITPAEAYEGIPFPNDVVQLFMLIGSVVMTFGGWAVMGKASSEIKDTKRKLQNLERL